MDDRLAANRSNWDDRARVHVGSAFYDVEGFLRSDRGPRPREIEALGDTRGLRLVHLQCHFGLDTLAFARAGAVVTGVDFSPVAIDAAREIAQRSGLADRATFVCADVHDAAALLAPMSFDVVYVSLGALCWLPRVDPWAAQFAALLAPGGRCYVHDVHPLSWALADDDGLRVEHTCFEEPDDPYFDDLGITYGDPGQRLEHTRNYQWNHGIGEIVTALLAHGLVIDALVEHDWTVWPRFAWLVAAESPDGDHWTTPPGMPRVPLTFTVSASRPA